jgi:hypothetical protein
MFMAGMAFSTMAGEDAKHVMAVEVVAGDSGEGVKFFLNSDDLGFDLDELQVGETRSVIDESGRSILITRNEDGFSFNVDGETIDMPLFQEADGDGIHWVAKDGDDVNVHVIRDVRVEALNEQNGTVILSPRPIDETTQQAIKSLLESSGYDSDVQFIDHEGEDGHAVRIKKVHKVVEAPQT